MKRSIVPAVCTSIVLLVTYTFAAGDEEKSTYKLQSKRSLESADRLEVVFEVGGTLEVGEGQSEDAKKRPPIKMDAKAALSYSERVLPPASSGEPSSRAVRWYDKAKASIQVGEDTFKPVLRSERRLIAVDVGGAKVLLFGVRGLLTREELDLVDLFGNSLLIDQLLPSMPVAVGATWKHSEKLLAGLCGVDSVSESDAQSVLQSVNEEVAQIEMAGYVAGMVNGRSTRMQIKSKYRFDLKAGRITWFAMLVKENRDSGPIEPGLDVVARLQMKITPAVSCEELADKALKDLSLEATAESRQLAHASPEGGWRLAHDRRWVLISEKKDLTVLRLADEGKYVAQCSISAVSSGTSKPLPLSEFQEEIRRALGKNFQQFVRASQSMSEAQYQVYRVEVRGEVSGVPVQWIYYRLADQPGRSMVVLFTIESNMGDRFHESDRDLVRAIRFVDPKVAAKPPHAAEATSPPK